MKKYLLICVLLTLLIGCKSKKKLTEREAVKIEATTEVKETKKNDITIDSIATKKSETITVTEKKDIELTQADPDKVITLIDSNGKKTTIQGANAIIRDSKEIASIKDTTSIELSKSDKSKSDKSENTKIDIDTNKRTSDSEVKGISPAIGFGIGIALIILLILIYLNRYRIYALFRR